MGVCTVSCTSGAAPTIRMPLSATHPTVWHRKSYGVGVCVLVQRIRDVVRVMCMSLSAIHAAVVGGGRAPYTHTHTRTHTSKPPAPPLTWHTGAARVADGVDMGGCCLPLLGHGQFAGHLAHRRVKHAPVAATAAGHSAEPRSGGASSSAAAATGANDSSAAATG